MSNWFTDIFTSGAEKVVDSVAGGLDDLFTSDDERLEAKRLMTVEMNKFKSQVLDAQKAYDKEITERWKSDNEHAVTRLVRPISFISVLAVFGIILFADGNVGEFAINPAYIPVIEGLLYTMVIAYFGSRGAEKITKAVKQ